jgi:hypothetical protein
MSESSGFITRILNWLTNNNSDNSDNSDDSDKSDKSYNSEWNSNSHSAWAYGTTSTSDKTNGGICNEIKVDKQIENSNGAIET